MLSRTITKIGLCGDYSRYKLFLFKKIMIMLAITTASKY